MTSLDIFGSCVTRDAFALVQHDYTIDSYHPRTSLISAYSKPVEIKKEDIQLKHEYSQRVVYHDMTKNLYNYLKETTAGLLIIDFMDERLGVVKTGDTYITNSDELKQSNVKSKLGTEALPIDSSYLELWELHALQFIHDIRRKEYQRIVVHKAYYCDQYYDKDGIKRDFTDSATVHRINERNQMLNHMYTFIERNIPEAAIIELKDFGADENHKWGLTPFHYESGYYEAFISSLNAIVTPIKQD